MSIPRQRLWKRRLGLVAVAVLVVLVLLDSFRRPADQYSASAYVGAVRAYQTCGRPVVKPFCTCRFYPSCSEYSVEAVQTHGIRYGLFVTARRLAACNGSTPLGTCDPVPPPDEWK
jgi:putative membrane protein insertion efficiency factor